MKDIPFGSPSPGSDFEEYCKNKMQKAQIEYFGNKIPINGSFAESPIDSRITALEKRVEELEKRHSLAQWHLNQFCVVNLPSMRSQLELRRDWVPAHIVAAIRHLSVGSDPDKSEVEEALRKR